MTQGGREGKQSPRDRSEPQQPGERQPQPVNFPQPKPVRSVEVIGVAVLNGTGYLIAFTALVLLAVKDYSNWWLIAVVFSFGFGLLTSWMLAKIRNERSSLLTNAQYLAQRLEKLPVPSPERNQLVRSASEYRNATLASGDLALAARLASQLGRSS
jgi:hypothetical protein